MKLLNKLLPIATITTAACAVAPIATSCTTNTTDGGSVKIDINQLLFSQYARKTAVKPVTKVTTYDEATDIYFNDVSKNPQILIDDIIEYGELFILDIEGFYPQVETLEQLVSGTLEFKANNVNASEHRVSVSCKADLHIDLSIEALEEVFGPLPPSPIIESLGIDVIPLDIAIDAKIKDMRFSSWYAWNPLAGDLAQVWAIQPDYLYYTPDGEYLYQAKLDPWLMKKDQNWGIDVDVNVQCPIYEELFVLADFALNYNYKSIDRADITSILSYIVPYCIFTPNYLANVELI